MYTVYLATLLRGMCSQTLLQSNKCTNAEMVTCFHGLEIMSNTPLCMTVIAFCCNLITIK